MAKYKLFIDETRSFRHVIELETELNDGELDGLLERKIDNNRDLNDLDDIKQRLIGIGLKVIEVSEDEAGDLGEIKIEEMEEIE